MKLESVTFQPSQVIDFGIGRASNDCDVPTNLMTKRRMAQYLSLLPMKWLVKKKDTT
jgi:hypothetical protein